ncbi:hypothetical protein WMF04_31245 [Sorangium sp. So ce260]|uniref:hypothetical protein n=1 Tax=Sorangium sp. So ce260 TaxID=3133291 RepID=UPI003F63CD6F
MKRITPKNRRLSADGNKLGLDAATQKEGGAATLVNSLSIPKQGEIGRDASALDARQTGEVERDGSELERPGAFKPSSLIDLAREKTIAAYHASTDSSDDESEIKMLDLSAAPRGELLDLAESVMRTARKTIAAAATPPPAAAGHPWWPYKSINKRDLAKVKEREKELIYAAWVNHRQAAHKRARAGMSNHMSREELRALGGRVREEKVGNCFDLAALTMLLLFEERGSSPGAEVDVVRLGDPLPAEQDRGFRGDHAFAVLNPPPADENGNYPDSFDDWGDAIIVDAWANIACPARDYPERWVEKMNRWKESGKLIDTVTATGAGLKPPDEHPWIDGILVFEKISVTKAPRREPAPAREETTAHGGDAEDHQGQKKCIFCSIL